MQRGCTQMIESGQNERKLVDVYTYTVNAKLQIMPNRIRIGLDPVIWNEFERRRWIKSRQRLSFSLRLLPRAPSSPSLVVLVNYHEIGRDVVLLAARTRLRKRHKKQRICLSSRLRCSSLFRFIEKESERDSRVALVFALSHGFPRNGER